jgi:hypothetical protein
MLKGDSVKKTLHEDVSISTVYILSLAEYY